MPIYFPKMTPLPIPPPLPPSFPPDFVTLRSVQLSLSHLINAQQNRNLPFPPPPPPPPASPRPSKQKPLRVPQALQRRSCARSGRRRSCSRRELGGARPRPKPRSGCKPGRCGYGHVGHLPYFFHLIKENLTGLSSVSCIQAGVNPEQGCG